MTSLFTPLIRVMRLAAFQPTLADPVGHVLAASSHAAADVPAHLLLAMAYFESRYYPDAVSRLENGKRAHGRWPSTAPAGSGPWYCGVVQTAAEHNWQECLALRDLHRGYQAGAYHLRNWLKATGGDMRKALNGYACGWAGLRNGCRGYADAVLRLAARLAP